MAQHIVLRMITWFTLPESELWACEHSLTWQSSEHQHSSHLPSLASQPLGWDQGWHSRDRLLICLLLALPWEMVISRHRAGQREQSMDLPGLQGTWGPSGWTRTVHSSWHLAHGMISAELLRKVWLEEHRRISYIETHNYVCVLCLGMAGAIPFSIWSTILVHDFNSWWPQHCSAEVSQLFLLQGKFRTPHPMSQEYFLPDSVGQGPWEEGAQPRERRF